MINRAIDVPRLGKKNKNLTCQLARGHRSVRARQCIHVMSCACIQYQYAVCHYRHVTDVMAWLVQQREEREREREGEREREREHDPSEAAR